jgi:hypothetical protein
MHEFVRAAPSFTVPPMEGSKTDIGAFESDRLFSDGFDS